MGFASLYPSYDGQPKPRGLAERGVDAVLPARTVFLEMVEHVAVDTERSPAPCRPAPLFGAVSVGNGGGAGRKTASAALNGSAGRRVWLEALP